MSYKWRSLNNLLFSNSTTTDIVDCGSSCTSSTHTWVHSSIHASIHASTKTKYSFSYSFLHIHSFKHLSLWFLLYCRKHLKHITRCRPSNSLHCVFVISYSSLASSAHAPPADFASYSCWGIAIVSLCFLASMSPVSSLMFAFSFSFCCYLSEWRRSISSRSGRSSFVTFLHCWHLQLYHAAAILMSHH